MLQVRFYNNNESEKLPHKVNFHQQECLGRKRAMGQNDEAAELLMCCGSLRPCRKSCKMTCSLVRAKACIHRLHVKHRDYAGIKAEKQQKWLANHGFVGGVYDFCYFFVTFFKEKVFNIFCLLCFVFGFSFFPPVKQMP